MPRFGPIKRKDLIRYVRQLGFAGPYSGGKLQKPQISQRGLWPQPNSKSEIRISNIEQGISNDETILPFDVHYSLFDIRHSLLNDKKLNALLIRPADAFIRATGTGALPV